MHMLAVQQSFGERYHGNVFVIPVPAGLSLGGAPTHERLARPELQTSMQSESEFNKPHAPIKEFFGITIYSLVSKVLRG